LSTPVSGPVMRAFGSPALFRQRPGLDSGGGKFAFQPGIGVLHRGGGGAQFFEQHGERSGIERRFEPRAAVGNGAAIIGKIGAANFDAQDQRLGLAMGGFEQCSDFGGAGFAAMGTAQGDDGGKIERALRHGSLNGKGQVIVFVADVAPEQVTDFGVRRQLRLTSGPGILSNQASSAPAGDGPVAVSASSWPVCTVMKPSALRWLCNGAGARGVRRLSLVAAAGFSRYDRRVNRAAPALCRPELFCR
jgi:hypothetical protein